jgi:hypothetical protein
MVVGFRESDTTMKQVLKEAVGIFVLLNMVIYTCTVGLVWLIHALDLADEYNAFFGGELVSMEDLLADSWIIPVFNLVIVLVMIVLYIEKNGTGGPAASTKEKVEELPDLMTWPRAELPEGTKNLDVVVLAGKKYWVESYGTDLILLRKVKNQWIADLFDRPRGEPGSYADVFIERTNGWLDAENIEIDEEELEEE